MELKGKNGVLAELKDLKHSKLNFVTNVIGTEKELQLAIITKEENNKTGKEVLTRGLVKSRKEQPTGFKVSNKLPLLVETNMYAFAEYTVHCGA